MIYRYPSFTLDTEKKTVLNKYGEKLLVTGNSYIMLDYLCQKKQGTLTDIGDVIDRAKDYNENQLRQYQYKLKTAFGKDIVLYENHLYRLAEDELGPGDPVREGKKTDGANGPPPIKRKFLLLQVVLMVLLPIALLAITYLERHKIQDLRDGSVVALRQKAADDMVEIPVGDFIMGSTETEAAEAFRACDEGNYCVREDYFTEYPAHTASTAKFSIDRKEVSNMEYEIFVKATGHRPAAFMDDSNLNGAIQPVVGVSWEDAQRYCEWAGKRLPTEIEWEKAARGTDGRTWPWGNSWDATKLNHGTGGDPGFDKSDGYEKTAPVGQTLGVSPYGLLNAAGNVSEWVNADFAPYPGNDKYLNRNFNNGEKVIRGGSYYNGKSDVRTTSRSFNYVANVDPGIGIRCARD